MQAIHPLLPATIPWHSIAVLPQPDGRCAVLKVCADTPKHRAPKHTPPNTLPQTHASNTRLRHAPDFPTRGA